VISFLLKWRLVLYLKSYSVEVFSYGVNLKILNYIKRRPVDEEEDSENESKLSESSTGKAEKEVTDKNSPLQRQLLGRGCYMDWRRKFPASIVHCLREKTVKYGCGPGEVKSTHRN
jgi:hypothetical protein